MKTATFLISTFRGSLGNILNAKIGDTFPIVKTTEKSILLDLSSRNLKNKWIERRVLKINE